ncbi:thermonuclease family protein [Bacillus sp. FJAT-47783]|uniref:thermonuclease family protein n=1 Tax=Bacillus sp. FJAT-47783 TaxID=2922712 RepID=UPI001FACBB95|nr:thermonuclease family protein [Bacillus sp. FJAT-47783]
MLKIFVYLIVVFMIVGCQMTDMDQSSSNSEKAYEAHERISATIVDVVDGDTMKIIVNGKEETIRLLLIDTPETVHPTKPVQPFGPEASQFAKEMLSNKEVEIELDVNERDKYGRLLVYVYINGQMFNEMLLENGLARVAYVYPPNTKYVDRFVSIEKKAKQKEIGIWSIENYVIEDVGFNDDLTESEPNSKIGDSCKIKGNINSDGEKIYHLPTSPWYEKTKPEAIFCTEREALDAGFRKAGA